MKLERDDGKRIVQLLCDVLKCKGLLERVLHAKHVQVEFFGAFDIIVVAILQV